MHDAGIRRYDLEVVEGFLAPAQEAVALAVTGELNLAVFIQRTGLSEGIDLHRVVDDQLGGNQRVDIGSRTAELDHGIAHRSKIDHAGHASEILQNDPCRHEGDFGIRILLGIPLGNGFDGSLGHRNAVFTTKQVLEQDFH